MNLLYLILIGTFLCKITALESENSGYEQAGNDVPPAPVSSDGGDQQTYNSEAQVANDSPKARKIKVNFQPNISDFSQFPGFVLPDEAGLVQVFNFNTRVEIQGDAPQEQKPIPTRMAMG